MIGYAFCGSFCSFKESLVQFSSLIDSGYDIVPIISENAYSTDTMLSAPDTNCLSIVSPMSSKVPPPSFCEM